MKIALLVPWWIPGTEEKGWSWETASEKEISTHASREDAIANKPDGYRHLGDGWKQISAEKFEAEYGIYLKQDDAGEPVIDPEKETYWVRESQD